MNAVRRFRGCRLAWLLCAGPVACLLCLPAAVSAQNDGPRPPHPSGLVTEVVPVATPDGALLENTLKDLFGEAKTGGAHIVFFAPRNALIVRGSAEQVQEIKGVLQQLGELADRAGSVRTLTLDRGSAATMAEALQNLLGRMRANPVKVILPGKAGDDTAKPEPPPKPAPGGKNPAGGKALQPITITAFGNRLIVTTDDPEAMALVVELFRLLQAPTGDGDFEVIRLKHVQATEVARILDEAFNGSQPGPGPFAGGTRAGAPRPERIRVVADTATNSLLIRASPLDTLSIRNLLLKSLDIPEAGDRGEKPRPGKSATERSDR